MVSFWNSTNRGFLVCSRHWERGQGVNCSSRVKKAGFFYIFLAGIWLVGCTPSQYAKWADKSAYRTLAKGEKTALGRVDNFDVMYKPLGKDAAGQAVPICIGGKTLSTDPKAELQKLTLDDCLEIAFRNSRTYQDSRENLYSAALNLANTRRGWDWPLFSGNLDAAAEFERVRKTGETKSAAAGINPTLTQRFVNGGVLTLAATLDWVTDFLLGSESNIVGSMLQANFTQPLIRGAWRDFAYEDQYRLERDFLFSVFDFDRYRQTFAVDIYTQYYSVLQQRDRLANDVANLERLKKTRTTTKILADDGHVSRIEDYQAESDLLNAQVAYKRNVQNYENSLDQFKITLGLPVKTRVELNYPDALEGLRKSTTDKGLKDLAVKENEAVDIALAVRPDVLTQRAAVRDAQRDVVIAADQFNPQLDIDVGTSVHGTEPRKFARLQFNRRTTYAGVTFNYDLDQIDNRDAYRLSIITYERAQRNLDEFIDQVRLDVRRSYRELLQSSESYEIQKRNVSIAQKRSILARLQQEAGTASARDRLEAENSLLAAQNGLTNALISYNTTRLQFLATLGMISVDKKGLLHEREKPFGFERITERYPYVGTEKK